MPDAAMCDSIPSGEGDVVQRHVGERKMSFRVPTSVATPVDRFRVVAFWEGVSYLLLLFVAMPLKYGLGIDMAVRIVGMAHGVLFLGYCVTLALAAQRLGMRRSLLAFVLSFVPGGTFWLEARLRQDERELARAAEGVAWRSRTQ
jgi:integral membrane protein